MPISPHAAVAAGTLPDQTVCCADRTRFCEAVTGLSFFNFDGCSNVPEFTEYPDGLSVEDVRFSVSCHADFPTAVLVYTVSTCGLSKEGVSVLYAGGAESLDIVLPAGTTAFGADFLIESQGSAETQDLFEVLRASVNNQTFTIPLPDSEAKPEAKQAFSFFMGFFSTLPITQLSFSGSDAGPVLFGIYCGRVQNALDAF